MSDATAIAVDPAGIDEDKAWLASQIDKMARRIPHIGPDDIPIFFPGSTMEFKDDNRAAMIQSGAAVQAVARARLQVAQEIHNDRAESIAVWLERMAAKHEKAALTDLSDLGSDRLLAIHYRARASDIRAGIDLPHD